MPATLNRAAERADAYAKITDSVLEALEAGTVPWHKPWATSTPSNAKSHKPYRGINVFTLALQGYTDPRWLTFKQARAMGGCVRKGEKGTPGVFWKRIIVDDAEGGKRAIPLLRNFTLFNVEQVDDLSLPELPGCDFTPVEQAEQITAAYPNRPSLQHGGDRACYAPFFDRVTMPVPSAFEDREAYYATLFHELVHSTGHEKRLKRPLDGGFRSDPYAKEELVAELGAAMLCGMAGIPPQVDASAAYIAGWLRRLRDDRKLLVHAAAAAQKAADHILNTQFDTED